jgi:hypothetical protein
MGLARGAPFAFEMLYPGVKFKTHDRKKELKKGGYLLHLQSLEINLR